jgi:putative membrane protein insertion efficiency factor
MTNLTSISSKRYRVPAHETNPSRGARALLGAIMAYQRLSSGRIAPCRFYPSCSHYAREAIEVHGAWRGAGLALRRLSRCRPLGPHGIDLVPLSKKVRSTES